MTKDSDAIETEHIKIVECSILWVEPEREAVLWTAKELVDYDMTQEMLNRMMLSNFSKRIADGAQLPNEWKDGKHPTGNFGYIPNENSPTSYSKLPNSTSKFVKVESRVIAVKERPFKD